MMGLSLPAFSTSFAVSSRSSLSRLVASFITASLSSAIWTPSLAEQCLVKSWTSRSRVSPMRCFARLVQCVSSGRILNGEGAKGKSVPTVSKSALSLLTHSQPTLTAPSSRNVMKSSEGVLLSSRWEVRHSPL